MTFQTALFRAFKKAKVLVLVCLFFSFLFVSLFCRLKIEKENNILIVDYHDTRLTDL